jgi:DNA polymerase-3 subunit gamma/tau
VAFNEQRSYNIYELDAASNNSVEDIRSLVEQVRIPPQIGRYKVYIIDEVHMLSSAAFNAFLKTLEEPPRHAVFILATTEKHKILPTILSRCQIYDFNRMSVEDTVNHLAYVAQTEGYTAEPEALNVIAQKADGGMRDALSIFDQVVSFTGGNITYQKVIENLNVLDYEYYFRLTDMLLENRVSDALLLFNEVLSKGFAGDHFITGLSAHFRDLLVSKDAATLPLLQVGASIRQRYSEQAQKCPLPFLYRAMKLCNDCDMNYRTSKNKRLLVELTLIQVAQIGQGDDDLSGGRRPKRQLKPIFKSQTAAQQPADNAGVAAQGGNAQQNVTKENINGNAAANAGNIGGAAGAANTGTTAGVAGAAGATAGAAGTAAGAANAGKAGNPGATAKATPDQKPYVGGAMAEQLAKSIVSDRKVPFMTRDAMGISIKSGLSKAAAQTAEGGANGVDAVADAAQVNGGAAGNGGEETKAAAPVDDMEFNERDLNHYWQAYANALPKDYVAFARRMQPMRLSLMKDGVSFEVVVDNDLSARDFRTMQPSIQSYLRKYLQNKNVQMQVRVSEAKETVRAVGRVERFQLMAKKNPSLLKLKKEFGLELY